MLTVKDATGTSVYRLTGGIGIGSSGAPFQSAYSTNAKRPTGILHRSGIGFTSLTTPAAPTVADVLTGGTLLANTSYQVFYTARSGSGVSPISSQALISTADDGNSTHVIRATLPVISGATSYLVSCSIASGNSLRNFVGEVSAAQLAGGGCRITGMGIVDTAGAGAAGTVDIQLVPPTIDVQIIQSGFYPSPDVICPVLTMWGSDVLTGGTLAPNVVYNWNVMPSNRWGVAQPITTSSIPTANDGNSTHVIRIVIPQSIGADNYDIFLGNDGSFSSASHFWVGRISEAQRAGGGCRITGLGIVDTGGANPAGSVDVQVMPPVDSSVAAASTYSVNSAMRPDAVALTATPVVCTGFSTAHIYVKISFADLRVAPVGTSITLSLFEKNQNSASDWSLVNGNNLTFPSTFSSGQEIAFQLSGVKLTEGTSSLLVVISKLFDLTLVQSPSVDIWVEVV
jgi:hypothetical protein